MNEKIKLLWDEAWDVVLDDDTPLSIIRERFAELIIRECADVIDQVQSEGGDFVRRHFGIKE